MAAVWSRFLLHLVSTEVLYADLSLAVNRGQWAFCAFELLLEPNTFGSVEQTLA